MRTTSISDFQSCCRVLVSPILLLLVTFSLTPAQEVTNADFEAQENSSAPGSWITGEAAKIETDENDPGRAMKLVVEPGRRKEFYQDVPVTPDGLSYYRLTARTRVDTAQEGRVSLWADIYGADSLLVNYGSTRARHAAWGTDTVDFFVPSNTEKIRIGGIIRGGNTAWFDDFHLQPLPFDTTVQISPVAAAYLDSAFALFNEHALYRKKLRLDEIRLITRHYADGAETVEDTHAPLYRATRLLADHHSIFGPADQVKRSLNLDTLDVEKLKRDIFVTPPPGKIDSLSRVTNYGRAELLNGNIGYLSVPAFTSLYKEMHLLFADTLQRRLAQLDQRDLSGWIIDLRDNSGGATPPMIMGVGPLLSEDNRMHYVDDGEQITATWYYRHGEFHSVDTEEQIDSVIYTSSVDYRVAQANLPIAILSNGNTASAAEGVMTIFHCQDNVRMFGTRSAGLTSGNDTFFLDDGSLLLLTASFLANRYQRVFRQGISPDVVVPVSEDEGKELTAQAAVQAAVEWIREMDNAGK